MEAVTSDDEDQTHPLHSKHLVSVVGKEGEKGEKKRRWVRILKSRCHTEEGGRQGEVRL